MLEIICDIYQLESGEYAKTDSNVRVIFVCSSNESIALYSDMASGQMYSYRVINQDTSITPQTKFIVQGEQEGDFSDKDTFIVIGDVKRQRVGGIFYLSGNCYKSEKS